MEPRNPYAAPDANADLQMPTGRLQAILVGAAVGNGIAYAVFGISGLAFMWVLVAQGVPTQELYVRAYAATGYLAFAHLLGFLSLVPGGYWSVKLSPDDSSSAALVAGALVAVLSLLGNLIPYDTPVPYWSRIASVVLPIPAFMLGAWWRNRARQE
jgi:hypothetical protein